MNISNNSFSLRDYLAYLFPGVLLLGAYFLFDVNSWEIVKKDSLLSGLIFLVGGYFLGYISNVFSSRTITKLIGKVFDNPFSTTLSSPGKNKFNDKFATIVTAELKKYWGDEVYDAGESNMLFLCWRDIQRSDHRAIDYQFRLVSLWNFCTSTLLPSLVLTIAFAIKCKYFLSAIFLIMFILVTLSRVGLRREFARNIYRIWYVINKSHNNGIQPTTNPDAPDGRSGVGGS